MGGRVNAILFIRVLGIRLMMRAILSLSRGGVASECVTARGAVGGLGAWAYA